MDRLVDKVAGLLQKLKVYAFLYYILLCWLITFVKIDSILKQYARLLWEALCYACLEDFD